MLIFLCRKCENLDRRAEGKDERCAEGQKVLLLAAMRSIKTFSKFIIFISALFPISKPYTKIVSQGVVYNK
jgi:hypothetical protein